MRPYIIDYFVNRKRTVIQWLMLALVTAMPVAAMGQDSTAVSSAAIKTDSTSGRTSGNRYDRRVNRMRRYWASLIPTQIVVQNAGNMGLISAGVGWQYGRRNQWETQILWGYIPKYSSSKAHLTNTVKQNYIPWSISFNDLISLEPLQSSIYLNTVYGHEFWRSQPGRYPDKYYEALSTKFRLNVAVGQQVTFSFNPEKYYFKRIKLFYEIGSCDLYIRSLFQGTSISFWDIIGLSLGVKMELL